MRNAYSDIRLHFTRGRRCRVSYLDLVLACCRSERGISERFAPVHKPAGQSSNGNACRSSDQSITSKNTLKHPVLEVGGVLLPPPPPPLGACRLMLLSHQRQLDAQRHRGRCEHTFDPRLRRYVAGFFQALSRSRRRAPGNGRGPDLYLSSGTFVDR